MHSARRALSTLVMLVCLLGVSLGDASAASARAASYAASHRGAVNQTATAIASNPGPGGNPVAGPQAGSIQVSAGRPRREVFGYALAWSLTDPASGYSSWDFSLLSTVAYFGVRIASDGNIVNDSGWWIWQSSDVDGLLSTAHAHGTKVVMSLIVHDFTAGSPNMCGALANRAFTVAQISAYVRNRGADGVNLDYEGVNTTCPNGQTTRSMLTDLVRQFRAALGSSADLSVATYASSATDSSSFFDIAGMNPYADSFFVMAYDFEWPNSSQPPTSCNAFCLGPGSPLTAYYWNDTTVARQYSAVVPAWKVILGLPLYGRTGCVSSVTPNAYPTTSATVDTYLDALSEIHGPSVQAGSYAIHRDVHDPTGQERWDTWFDTARNCTRELYWDDTASLGQKYDLVNRDGLRGVGFWTLNYGGGSPELWSTLFDHFVACGAGVGVSASTTSPAQAGTPVTITGSAAHCPNANPLYQFWTQDPGATTWQLAQPYSTSAAFQWDTTGKPAGTYRIAVWVHDSGGTGVYSNGAGRWDDYGSSQFTLTTDCKAVSVSSSPTSAANAGTAITITAGVYGCPTLLYQFSVLAPGASSWQLAQGYSFSAVFHWDTTGKAPGTYGLSVSVRAGVRGVYYPPGNAGTFDNGLGTVVLSKITQYTLTTTPCTWVDVSSSPSSPAAQGTPVSVSAFAVACPKPLYQFWVLAPGATSWTVAQPYSTSATLSWNTAGKARGTYGYSVWARDASSPGVSGNSSGTWDAYNTIQYVLS